MSINMNHFPKINCVNDNTSFTTPTITSITIRQQLAIFSHSNYAVILVESDFTHTVLLYQDTQEMSILC